MTTVNEKKKGLRWRKTANAILTAAGVKQSSLAAEIGEKAGYVNRYFTGRRMPSLHDVERINRAIAQLSGVDRVVDLLEFEALASGLLPARDLTAEELARGANRILSWYQSFLKPGATKRIMGIADTFGESARRRLFIRLNLALRRIVLGQLLPSERPVGFSAVIEALISSGIPLDGIESEQSAKLLAWERFECVVNHEIAAANPGASARERLAAAKRIRDAIDGIALAAVNVKPDFSGPAALIEVTKPAMGTRESTFHDSARAVWAPFQPKVRHFLSKINVPTAEPIAGRPSSLSRRRGSR